MGWSSGTSILDNVIASLASNNIKGQKRQNILVPLIRKLMDGDADCLDESMYAEKIYLRKALIYSGYWRSDSVCFKHTRFLDWCEECADETAEEHFRAMDPNT